MKFPDHLSDLVIMDCDEVLLDWTRSFAKYVSSRGYQAKISTLNKFDMTGWLGVPEAKIQSLIADFNSSHHFANIQPCGGAKALVDDFIATGHRIHIITSCSSDPWVIAMRKENLKAAFGAHAFEEICCLPIHGNKIEELARRPASLWFDDRLKNVHDGISAGHFGIVVKAPQNVEDIEKVQEAGIPYLEHLSLFREAIPHLPHVVRSNSQPEIFSQP